MITKHVVMPTVLLILLGAFVAASATAREKYSETVELSLALKGEKTLSVSSTNGTIEIRPGLGNEVGLKAIKTCSDRRKAEAEDVLKGIEVKMERDGDHIRVYSEYKGSKVNLGFGKIEVVRGFRNIRVDFYLVAPPEMAVGLNSTSGDIDVKGMKAGADINVTSGDCLLSGISGSVRLSATSGDAEIEDVDGSLEVNNTSGDLVIRNAKGDVDANVTSGDVSVKQVGGQCRIESVSGDIDVTGCRKSVAARSSSGDITVTDCYGAVNVETSSGDVVLTSGNTIRGTHFVRASSGEVIFRLKMGAGCGIDVSTASGGIYGRIPINIESATRHRLKGTVGKGGDTVEIETASGDVRLVLEGQQ